MKKTESNISLFFTGRYNYMVIIALIIAEFYAFQFWLTSLSGSMSCGGSGFIGDLWMCPSIDYIFGWHTFIGFVLIISIFFLCKKYINFSSYFIQKLILSCVIITLGFFSPQIIKIVNPPLYLKYHQSGDSSYRNSDGTIDIEKYIALKVKCREEKNYCFVQGLSQKDMSISDYIASMEAAKKYNFKELYRVPDEYNRSDWKEVLEELIVEYNDVTFQAYIIQTSSNLDLYSLILNKTNDEKIKEMIHYSIHAIKEYRNIQDDLSYDQREIYSKVEKHLEKYNKYIEKNIQKHKILHHKMIPFYY